MLITQEVSTADSPLSWSTATIMTGTICYIIGCQVLILCVIVDTHFAATSVMTGDLIA